MIYEIKIFIAGLLIGVVVGIFVAALLSANGRDDE